MLIISDLLHWYAKINAQPNADDAVNPILGITDDAEEASRMHNVWEGTSVRTVNEGIYAVRSCKKLTKAELRQWRAVMYGVYQGKRTGPWYAKGADDETRERYDYSRGM